jgi:flavorubredoxin
MTARRSLPRELAPGVHWLGDCLEQPYNGRIYHGYNSAYLVVGEDASLLVEAGFPQDLEVVEAQLDALLRSGLPELRYVFTTHQETPHSSGLGRLLTRYENAVALGDVSDFHLVFPQFSERFRPLRRGEAIDLGGTEFVSVEAVIRDLESTQWGFDTARGVLFPGDGFAYSHYHEDGHCGHLAEEAGSLDIPDMTALFAELALHWTTFQDMTPFVGRLEDLVVDELDVQLIAPTHGLPIGDVGATLPRVVEGLYLGSRVRAS